MTGGRRLERARRPLAAVARARRGLRTRADISLLARMIACAVFIRVFKRILPLATLTRLLRPKAQHGTRRPVREVKIAQFADWIVGVRLGRCLERSLLVYRFLGRTEEAPRLVVGLRRCEGDIRGHAWVVYGGRVFNESEAAVAGFETVVEFGPDGHPALSPSIDSTAPTRDSFQTASVVR
jgi:hypothetical protein